MGACTRSPAGRMPALQRQERGSGEPRPPEGTAVQRARPGRRGGSGARKRSRRRPLMGTMSAPAQCEWNNISVCCPCMTCSLSSIRSWNMAPHPD